jgi:hypothetical protein
MPSPGCGQDAAAANDDMNVANGGTDGMCTMICPGQDMAQGCTSSTECTVATQPICDLMAHTCRACGTSTECGGISAAQPLCSSSTGACVECLSNNDCIASRKSCNVQMGTCVPCAVNTDCASGLCSSSGMCADPSTLVYVNASTCPSTGAGTFQSPFCKVKDGLDKGVTMAETVIVFGGTYPENISITGGVGTVYTVSSVGVGGPVIMPMGAGPAVALSLSGGTSINVTLDGFTIKSAMGAMGNGVFCQGGGSTTATKLTLLRSTVTNNAQNAVNATTCDVTLDQDVIGPMNAAGGILLSGSDFTLQNSLVIGNGTAGASTFGGINVATTATRANIVNVTVVNNNAKTATTAAGLTCGAQPSVINSVFVGNVGPVASPDLNAGVCLPDHSSFNGASVAGMGTNNYDLVTCGASATAIESAIFYGPSTSDYHAKTGGAAPCTLISLGTSSGAPSYDLDGKVRPSPPSIGCLEMK